MFSFQPKVPKAGDLLPGRSEAMAITDQHYINGKNLKPPFATGAQQAVFGLGCFWGAERCFWKLDGVITTAVGYAGGSTPNPTYHEVCSGMTGHTEAVLVVFDPAQISYAKLLQVFFESHDPTQGMRQGNDVGTQYRSAIYTFDDIQAQAAKNCAELYEEALKRSGYRAVTTEIAAAGEFFYAEDYHQQYLAKNPGGYCGLGGTGVACPGTDSASAA
jgi:peptide-methionine (S)-S-oxide reductase